MANLGVTLEIAKDTLLNTQIQLQTATNNIANADSTTYSRQKAVLSANKAVLNWGGWIGMGATVTNVTQVRDQYIEQKLLGSISQESYYGTLTTQLETVQAAVVDYQVTDALGSFWDAWDLLSQNAAGGAEQNSVYAAAETLAENIRSEYERLESNDMSSQITETVDQANELIQQIADYNQAIANIETSGYTANDLRDLRYEALQGLAELIPVSFTEDEDGALTVTTTNEDGVLSLISGGTVDNFISTDSTITGGKLGGLRTAQADIEDYKDILNEFASTLIEQVNTAHNLDGGLDVFSGTGALDIASTGDFLSDSTGEAARALAVAELQETKITFSDGTQSTLSQYVSNFQKRIGTDTEQAQTKQTFYESLTVELQTQQQAISGVSIDEEMVDVLKFQNVYQAAAKVVQTTTEMLDSIISMV